eukprot:TRINITY_DN9524_c0_g1_i2.p1 TRINITY_DN9524_c0_g1~~TRINITY_DN9524_c0_g1_i2.p1  ORF type:complete len:262 (+),score=85.13 TRINITY_DN9524_c0_g1_i2:72-788(+)
MITSILLILLTILLSLALIFLLIVKFMLSQIINVDNTEFMTKRNEITSSLQSKTSSVHELIANEDDNELAHYTFQVQFMDTVPLIPDWLMQQFPFHRRFGIVDANGWDLGIHFVDHLLGKKEAEDCATVIMIHGNPSWSFLWRKVIVEMMQLEGVMERGVRVIAPDLLGCGLSDKPDDEEVVGSVAMHIATITSLIKGLELPKDQPVVAVGQDWGGPIVTAVVNRLRDEEGLVVDGMV